MNRTKCRKIGALWAIGQGLLTALVPQLSATMFTRMVGKNFDNAADLEVKPAYLRQLRALGVGLAVAGVSNLLLDRAASEPDSTSDQLESGDRDEA